MLEREIIIKYTDDNRIIERPMNEYYVGNLFIRLPEDF